MKYEYLSKLIEKPVSGEWGTDGEKIPVLRSTNFTMDGFLDLSNVKYRDIDDDKIAKKMLQKGDILIEKSGGSLDQPVGRVVFFDEEGDYLFSNFTSALRPKQTKVFPKYLNYILLSAYKGNITSYFQNRTTGIINLQLTRYVNELQIPLPPLATQRKIAEVLDKADAIRKRSQKILAKYDQLAQSVFLEMFGDPVKNEKGWEVQELNTMLNFLTSGSRGWAKYYSDSGAIFLRIQNIGYNKLRLDNLTYVKSPDSAESKRTKVQAKDIILSITADLGRTAVIPDNFPVAHINQHLAIIRLKETFNPYFVSAYVATKGGQALLLKLNKGGVKDGLNFNDIKSYKVFSPPLRLQNQFAAIISQIESQKSQTQLELDRAEELYQSLLQRAFTGALFPETTYKELTHT